MRANQGVIAVLAIEGDLNQVLFHAVSEKMIITRILAGATVNLELVGRESDVPANARCARHGAT